MDVFTALALWTALMSTLIAVILGMLLWIKLADRNPVWVWGAEHDIDNGDLEDHHV